MKQRTVNQNQSENKERKKASVISHKIGSTTYEVNVHFSEKSKETIQDKILRLIRAEVTV